ncbi:autotransporter assembly complex protein TamA [Kiloniella litopenaei]|uniref:autotransporter assembly complex protein TamA n=1 Tax=Kiloniella litopenaei TaxID=1549748 RepID=UPI0009E5EEDE|nr:autotransporter assembly complex family protein [Kiloniella litopenaei]
MRRFKFLERTLRPPRCNFVFLFLTLLSFGVHSSARAQDQATSGESQSYGYEVSFSGDVQGDLLSLIEESSRLKQLKDKLPSSLAALKRRVREDSEGFDKVLRSEGYYDNTISYDVDESQRPINIVYEIKTGPQFYLNSFRIIFKSGKQIPSALNNANIGISTGVVARSEVVVEAKNRAIVVLADHGYPDAKLADQDVVVDFATQKMDVTLVLDEGPRLVVGNLEFEGLKDVDANYLQQLSQWKAGILYNAKIIDELRRKYLRTGLFEAVRMKPLDTTNAARDGTYVTPITMIFVEREHKSVGLGASFSTSEGAGTQFFWENRNTFGQGEKLRADLTVAEIRQQLKLGFNKPNYLRNNQSLNANINIKHEDTDAYEEKSVSAFVGIDRKWGQHWTVGGGLELELSEIQDEDDTESYAFASIPLSARYDSTNDLLDPTTGFRFGVTATPYYGLTAASPEFFKTEIDGSTYYSILDDDRLVFATRGKIGLLAGDSSSDIPATKRFYAGGGGSIRGYEHQTVGPLNSSDDPVGGRSLVEFGAEARVRVTEDIGLVPFIEGGNVYDSAVPDFFENFQWGAGLGLRYYTAIGPIRLDVAVPLNRRKDIDDAWQFYVSIGQAF